MDDSADKLLEKIYTNAQNPGSFGGVNRLYEEAKILENKLKLSDVKNYLKSSDTYTLHKDIRKKFPRQQTIVSGMDSQWQADLVVMPDLAKYNDGHVYILTVIDILSKYAWAEPLKQKTGVEVTNAFRKIFATSGRKPQKLQTDKGVEFLNSTFQNFLKAEQIEFFTTNSDLKAAICERFNRTLKSKMWRYFTENNTRRFLEVLPSIMESYNNSKHRTIGIEPASVTVENQTDVWKRIYKPKQKTLKKPKKPKFFVNEPVRISSHKSPFSKSYEGNWTTEIFYIDKIYFQHLPFMYRVRDTTGEIIKGRFYEQELQSVKITAEKEYKIERIIKRRKLKGKKPEVLIKWLGYPDSANTWEPEENIKHFL
jgi:Chromo (CHRromatin Organisation MOdifier) domain/Integrase core domain